MNGQNSILRTPRPTHGWRRAGVVACVAAACTTFSSAIVTASPASAENPRALSAVAPVERNGHELLRGLFFLSGPVVELVPELREARDQVEAAGHATDPEVISRIIDRIDADDPVYLQEFAAAIQSGDHVTVRDVLSEAGDRIVRAAEHEFGIEPGQGPEQRLTLGLVLAAAMAVVSVAWLAGGISVIFTMMAPSVSFRSGAEGRSVPADRAVDAIVRHFGPAST